MAPVEAVIVGAGGRGSTYANYAMEHPNELVITAVAEPIEERRMRLASQHDIPPERCYSSWEELLEKGRITQTAFNCTMDRTHFESTIALLNAGYDVLLEKPMSPVLEENVRLVQICHVLRYSAFWQKLREIVQSGKLGRIISVDHRENLHFLHISHSFVRGNWRNEATSGPMILAKCCHDLDILYWILQQKVSYINSFGSLTHFRPENAPAGAPLRCTDGCPVADDCKYYAPRRYAKDAIGWPFDVVALTPTVEARMEALHSGPYGRCVYHCDNDVVDHQTLNMELTNGTTVTLTMQGQSEEESRTMRYDGTEATLYAKFAYGMDDKITIHHHLSGEVERIIPTTEDGSGHGGGDSGIVRSFLNAINGNPDDSITTARESLESHLLAFAAEDARLNHTVVHMPDFRIKAEDNARKLYQ